MTRRRLVDAALVVAALAWTAWWVADAWPISGLSWHFFVSGSNDLLKTDGLSVYAHHPELQVGPLPLAVAGVFGVLPSSAAKAVALIVMTLVGLIMLALLATIVPADRRRPRLFLAALFFLPAWTILSVRWGHLDDVLAIAAAVCAVVALAQRRPVLTGVALGVAMASKPWAVGFVPLILALPRERLRAAGAAFGTAAIAWLPFILGDTGTMSALHPPVALAPGSGLRTLGARGSVVPAWGRTVQLLLTPAAALAVAWTRRWAGVLLVAIAVRMVLDPQDNAYYIGSAAMAAVVFDLLGTRWLVPWTTMLTVVLLWQPFVRDYTHRLTTTTGLTHWWFAHQGAVGWVHLAWAAAVVAIVMLVPPSSLPSDRRREDSPPLPAPVAPPAWP